MVKFTISSTIVVTLSPLLVSPLQNQFYKDGGRENMKKPKLHERIKIYFKRFISYIGWKIFIWASDTTEDQYWTDIYNQEKFNIDNADIIKEWQYGKQG